MSGTAIRCTAAALSQKHAVPNAEHPEYNKKPLMYNHTSGVILLSDQVPAIQVINQLYFLFLAASDFFLRLTLGFS